MLTRPLYNLGLGLLAPLFALAGWRRCRKARALGLNLDRCLASRWGHVPDDWQKGGIWLHAVSVGESRSIFPLLKALHQRHPALPLTVTNGSVQGALQVRRFAPVPVHNTLIPYDYPGAVARFLDQLQPRLVVIVETELWPNLYHACRQRGIPLVVINARIKQRSFERYRRWGQPLVGETLRAARAIAAQFPVDAERLIALGADPAAVYTLGNLKFDLSIPEDLSQRAQAFRHRNGLQDRFVWVAGSTHAGEEEQILAAHRQLLQQHPDALLILVPRHADRFESVWDLLEKNGWMAQKRSSEQPLQAHTQVLLGDTVGELLLWYAMADAAFVGGSLVPFGGHNPIEPAALGTPVLSGPHVMNLQALYDAFTACQGVHFVADSTTLAATLQQLADNPALRQQWGQRAHACYREQAGVLERVMALLEPYLAAGEK
ncbi:3-deoxy-D-manno-octulosonic-acid transferase [Sulfurivirga caldicuralii]|uniref:3-deoxy-D-manno-octulosonic acid transferase n=1 Tax=Sulfurivirga caldicuralii TaxID=364032 RepID=A0A1N6DQ99_9GAMM|nr:lipid IV(A) 3-deoxy-D-manno-octulosonic acid transferase [Sulfurivirga caldicuralii]SIN72979.1 3-deoxy-D-manno-octulosonic-acid transferase [Sulfurivirga caldicuralii]